MYYVTIIIIRYYIITTTTIIIIITIVIITMIRDVHTYAEGSTYTGRAHPSNPNVGALVMGRGGMMWG